MADYRYRSPDDVRIDGWQSKSTGKWHTGIPTDYPRASRLRIQYDYVKLTGQKIPGKHGYFYLKKWGGKPGLTTKQRTDWIESVLPNFVDPYLTRNA